MLTRHWCQKGTLSCAQVIARMDLRCMVHPLDGVVGKREPHRMLEGIELRYQLALRTPGSMPLRAISRKVMRDSPK